MRRFKKGDRVIVIADYCSHKLPIGTIVTLGERSGSMSFYIDKPSRAEQWRILHQEIEEYIETPTNVELF